MLYRRTIFTFVLAAFLLSVSPARGDDVDDLKAAHEQAVKAINQRDLDAYLALMHDKVVQFAALLPRLDGKAALRQAYQPIFNNSESITLSVINPQFRIIGTTGVVWSRYQITIKSKDGPAESSWVRFLFTYTKSEGKWLMATRHISLPQSEN